MRATKEGNFPSIYQQFHNSPDHFVAVRKLAKWFHPDGFEDLALQATFEELHKRFLPFEASGQFWLNLKSPP